MSVMAPSPPRERISPSGYLPTNPRRPLVLPARTEGPLARQETQRHRGAHVDPWLSIPSSESDSNSLNARYSESGYLFMGSRTHWINRDLASQPLANSPSPWATSSLPAQYPNQAPIPQTMNQPSPRSAYPAWSNSWPGPLLRRTSSEDARLNQFGGSYYGGDPSASMSSFGSKSYPRRQPSNRDEFDGPSQLLDKPEDSGYEPKEEDLPQLPVNLYAQEQDEILSQVNDRLSQCAFDFVAKYQFPIPVEPDKRPVRVPSDREWSEWVYLLKRLATKRRIPLRVLYNGQIKQLITILENSLEMRHAAKHQSRPLKDDRNILQLISSGLQVAKILKDANAMQGLDNLYVQTERLIQSRRATAHSASGTMGIM